MRPTHSTTAVLQGQGRLQLASIPIPQLHPGESLVRVTACTICGSDLHTWTGRRGGPLPSILGHEIIGTVVECCIEANDTRIQVGDRVTWSVAASCGSCHRCASGIPQKCDSLLKYGHENCDEIPLSGGLSEYCVLRRGTTVVPIPKNLQDEVACPASCATATVSAAMRLVGSLAGKRVLISGAGMLGLTTSAFANAANASDVVVCDIDGQRLQRATAFGATRLVSAIDNDDFDAVFEMTGNAAVVTQCIEAATVGGTVALVGSVSPSDPVAIDPERVVRRLLTIRGVHNYVPDDLTTAVSFLAQNHERFPFADLVEATFPLSESEQALNYAESVRPVRVAINP